MQKSLNISTHMYVYVYFKQRKIGEAHDLIAIAKRM